MPVLLLIAGVSLVGIAAVFFLVFAWFVWGIAVRALIIGAITLASILSASLLRRRSLTATAEGIGALGIVLLGLDAWAVRANDFFGTGAVEAATYAGVSALVVGAVCRVWARFSGLRGPDLAAAVALPTGVGLLIGGMLALPPAEAAVAGLLGASVGGLLHALPAPVSSARSGRAAWPERVTLAVIGVASLLAAAVTTAVATGPALPVVVWSAALTLLLGTAHGLLLAPRGDAEPLPGAPLLVGIASSVAVASAGLAGWQLVLREDEPILSVLVAPVLGVVTAVVVDLLRARRGGLFAASVTAAAVGVVSLGVVAIDWTRHGFFAIATSWSLWTTDPLAPPPSWIEAPYLALPSALLLAAALFFAPTLRRPVLRDLRVAAVAVLVLAAAARPAVPAILVGVAVVVAVAAVVALVRSTARAGWLIACSLGAGIAYTAGLAAPVLWLVGVSTAVALPIALRLVLRASGPVAVGLTLAALGAASLSALIAPAALSAASGVSGAQWQVSIALLQWVALAAIAVAALTPLDRASRLSLAFGGYALVAATLLWTAAGYSFVFAGTESFTPLRGFIGDPILAVVRGVALLGAVVAVALRRTRVDGPAATAAAALVAPVLAYAIHETLGVMGIRDLAAVPLVPLAGAVAVVALGAWASLAGDETRGLRMTRLAADAGAIATALIVVWPIGTQHVWAVWALATVGFASLAACAGWAAPARDPDGDVYATGSAGLPLSAAPRRVLMWPAALTAVLGWWSFLGPGTPGASFSVEAEAIPAGALLVGFAAMLVWLRRRAEATIALGTGLALALWMPAIESWSGTPVRGAVVAAAATAVCLALSWGPLRRIEPVAAVGAVVGLAGLGLVSVERALSGDPVDAGWLLLLTAVAYLSGLGMARDARRSPISLAYATVVPAVTLAIAVVVVLRWSDDARVVTAALVTLLALHVAAAALDRPPLSGGTRWTALVGAGAVSVAAVVFGTIEEIEAASLPLAAAILTGAALAALRLRGDARPWPGGESIVWVGGLVVATVPSVLAPAEPARIWMLIIACIVLGAAAAWVRMPDEWRVRIPTALTLGGAAVATGVRALLEPSLGSADAAANTAGVGAIAIGVLLVARSVDDRTSWPPVVLGGAGAALLVTSVLARSEGELAPTAVTALLGGLVGVVAASCVGLARWRGLAAVLAIGGLVVAVAACGIRVAVLADAPGLEADLWAVVGATVAAAIVVAALRALPTRAMGLTAGVVLSLVIALFAVAELALQWIQAPLAPEIVTDGRAVVVMALLTLAAALGAAARGRVGFGPALTAAIAALVFAVTALFSAGVSPVELVTVPPAVGGILYGTRALVRDPHTRTWPALGPWIALLTIPSLLHDFGESELWRVVALGIVALGLVIVGASLRLQAPLVLGSAVLIAHATAQLWPWIRTAYVAVPWWLWLGIGGALLIFLAATYERRVRQMKTAFVTVAALR